VLAVKTHHLFLNIKKHKMQANVPLKIHDSDNTMHAANGVAICFVPVIVLDNAGLVSRNRSA
jgi:hypothetical protein